MSARPPEYDPPADPAVPRRTFSAVDQVRFAEISGDFNPMHLDPIRARRTQAGAPVVHGMHAVLWALDELCSTGAVNVDASSLRVEFCSFLYVDDEVKLVVRSASASVLRADLVSDGRTVVTVALAARAAVHVADLASGPPVVLGRQPLDLDWTEIAAQKGTLLVPHSSRYREAFPHASERFGEAVVEGLAALSTIVGMLCPGLHSIFHNLKVSLEAAAGTASAIDFRVREADERFRMVEITVRGSGIAGALVAFVRQAPAHPPRLHELAQVVRNGEFSGTRALVVGGSRGLGALTARLLVAGGAQVVATYLVGEAEARELVDELGSSACRVVRYDARAEPLSQLGDLSRDVHQLYYFATSQIFRDQAGLFDPARYREYAQIYVIGFEAICSALRMRGNSLTAFYPSSTAVDERVRGLTEYAMAKAAGEILCEDLCAFDTGLHILVKRLPRILTDQTATVVPVESATTLETMLPIVREMMALSSRTPV